MPGSFYGMVNVRDLNLNPVSGATVTGQVVGGDGAVKYTLTAATDADGRAWLSKAPMNGVASGQCYFRVTGITKSGMTADLNMGYGIENRFWIGETGPAATPTPTPAGPTSTPAGPTATPTSAPTATPTPSNTGYVNPAADAAATGGDGDGFGTTPANGYTDNATFAVDTNSGTNTTTTCTDAGKDRHVFYSYNLSSVPGGATIVGLEVRLDVKVDATTGSPKSCVEISWDGGTSWTAAKTTATFTKSEASYVLGGAADNWGRSWTVAELANLRVRITNVASNVSRDFSLDWAPVKVYYQ
jgi:hypothetical protein